MTEFSARWLSWFGLGWAAVLPGFSRGTNGPCACAGPGRWEPGLPRPGSLHPSGSRVCHDRALGLVPRLSLPLFLSILQESLSCQNGWLRLPRGGHSHSCTGSVSNGDKQVLVLAGGVLAAVIACLFGSSEGEPKVNLAISPVLSFIPHSHAFGSVESGSL